MTTYAVEPPVCEGPVIKLPAPSVATEYTEPAKEVATPAPSVAKVMAWPPAEVMTVIA